MWRFVPRWVGHQLQDDVTALSEPPPIRLMTEEHRKTTIVTSDGKTTYRLSGFPTSKQRKKGKGHEGTTQVTYVYKGSVENVDGSLQDGPVTSCKTMSQPFPEPLTYALWYGRTSQNDDSHFWREDLTISGFPTSKQRKREGHGRTTQVTYVYKEVFGNLCDFVHYQDEVRSPATRTMSQPFPEALSGLRLPYDTEEHHIKNDDSHSSDGKTYR